MYVTFSTPSGKMVPITKQENEVSFPLAPFILAHIRFSVRSLIRTRRDLRCTGAHAHTHTSAYRCHSLLSHPDEPHRSEISKSFSVFPSSWMSVRMSVVATLEETYLFNLRTLPAGSSLECVPTFRQMGFVLIRSSPSDLTDPEAGGNTVTLSSCSLSNPEVPPGTRRCSCLRPY